jgi:hypothetical protein
MHRPLVPVSQQPSIFFLIVTLTISIASLPAQEAPGSARKAEVTEEFVRDLTSTGKIVQGVVFYMDSPDHVYRFAEPTLILNAGPGLPSAADSLDGRHAASAVSTRQGKQTKWDVMLDGRTIQCQADEVTRLSFSPDGKRLAFAARYGQQSQIRVVGEPDGPLYDWVASPVFSPDSARLIYAAGSESQVHVVIDHKPAWSETVACRRVTAVRPDDTAFSAFFSPDSKSWAVALTRCTGMQAYNVNGKVDAEDYGTLSPVVFTPDGQHFAYAAVKIKHGWMTANKGAGVVVVDGKPSETYEGLGGAMQSSKAVLLDLIRPDALTFGVSSPAYTRDGQHLFYAAHTKQGFSLMLDGNPGPAFDAIITDPVASADSRHFGYMAIRNKELLMVVDDKVTGLGSVIPFDDFSFVEDPGFVPGGRFAAVVTKHGKLWDPSEHARRRMLLDGKVGAEYDCRLMSPPLFSPDGLHYVQIVLGIKDKTVRQGDFARIIVDGWEGPDYDAIQSVQKVLGATATYFAVKAGKLYRVTQRAPEAGGPPM